MPSLPGDLLDPGIELGLSCLLHWQVGSLPIAPPGKPLGSLTEKYEESFPRRLFSVCMPLNLRAANVSTVFAYDAPSVLHTFPLFIFEKKMVSPSPAHLLG